MSYDLGVWYPTERLSNEAATATYIALCEGKPTSLQPHPSIDAFYQALYARYPELDDIPEDRVDDHDFCPWSAAHDRSGAHMVMCCVHSQADNVHRVVRALAREHGLAFYDPQAGTVEYPDSDPQEQKKPWWRFGR